MNNNLKVVCGTLAGFVLGGLTVVGANQAIQAIQNTDIKISLNGEVQEFKDESTGERQYPITYNDRTYLPLRNVANLAGLNVDYDNATNTALLSNMSLNTQIKIVDNYLFVDNVQEAGAGGYDILIYRVDDFGTIKNIGKFHCPEDHGYKIVNNVFYTDGIYFLNEMVPLTKIELNGDSLITSDLTGNAEYLNKDYTISIPDFLTIEDESGNILLDESTHLKEGEKVTLISILKDANNRLKYKLKRIDGSTIIVY